MQTKFQKEMVKIPTIVDSDRYYERFVLIPKLGNIYSSLEKYVLWRLPFCWKGMKGLVRNNIQNCEVSRDHATYSNRLHPFQRRGVCWILASGTFGRKTFAWFRGMPANDQGWKQYPHLNHIQNNYAKYHLVIYTNWGGPEGTIIQEPFSFRLRLVK